jgi:leucyl-tRNA synthetase
MSMGPMDASRPWETRAVIGAYRLLQRIWRNMVDEETGASTVVNTAADDETRRAINKTIDGIRNDYEGLRYNTAIAKLTELNNHLTGLAAVPREIAEPLVLMLAPLAPHISEELWAKLGRATSLARVRFPEVDERYLVASTIDVPISINGKARGVVTVPANADEATIIAAAQSEPKIAAQLDGATIRKTIYVPGRMVNFVIG